MSLIDDVSENKFQITISHHSAPRWPPSPVMVALSSYTTSLSIIISQMDRVLSANSIGMPLQGQNEALAKEIGAALLSPVVSDSGEISDLPHVWGYTKPISPTQSSWYQFLLIWFKIRRSANASGAHLSVRPLSPLSFSLRSFLVASASSMHELKSWICGHQAWSQGPLLRHL